MNRRLLLCCFFLIAFFSGFAFAQNYETTVTLTDSTKLEGILLSISPAGVEINPGGAVKMRFISAERINTVYVPVLQSLLYYPLDERLLPEELREFKPQITHGAGQNGFSSFLLKGIFGYGSAGNADYYKGFHDGFAYGAGIHYLFHESLRSDPHFMIGFTFNSLTVSGDKIFGIEPELTITEYSFEFGRTSAFFDNKYFFHLLMGVVYIENKIELPVAGAQTFNEEKAGIRVEVGVSILLRPQLLLQLSAGTDVIVESTDKTNNTYGYTYNTYEQRAFNGWIPKLMAGLVYTF